MTIFEIAVLTATASSVLAAIIVALQGPMRVVLSQFMTLFVTQKAVDDAYSVRILTDFLNKHGKRFSLNRETYEASYRHIRPLAEERNVFYRSAWSSYGMWLYKKRLIVLVPGDGQGSDPAEAFIDKATFMFLRGSVNWEKLLVDAANDRDDEIKNYNNKHKRFTIMKHWSSSQTILHNGNRDEDPDAPKTDNRYKHQAISDDPGDPIHWTRDDIGPPISEHPIGTLSMTKSMEKVVDRVKFWYKNKQWYKDRGLTWKVGILMYGPPGNGKTSLARAICEELDLPLHIIDMSEMDSDDLTNAWARSRYNKPRAVLLEDIDTIFHKRKNVTKTGSVAFETVLNLIDGADRDDGLLLFVNTNKVDKIDEALGRPVPGDKTGRSTRPSRIDMTAHVGNPDRAGRVKIGMRILRDEVLSEELADKYPEDSGAQFQDRCIEAAKDLFWKGSGT